MLIIKVVAEDGQFVTLYLENDWSFSKLNELIKDQLNIPVNNQRLYLDGVLLSGNNNLISDSGLKDGDLLLVKADYGNMDLSSLLAPEYADISDDLLRTRAREILDEFNKEPAQLETLKFHNQELYKAVQSKNTEEVYKIVKKEYEEKKKEEMEHKKKLMKAYLDPLNPESQILIHKEIEKNRIDENLLSAQNYFPESFGKIVMLFIKVEINNVVVKALVDTGAQNTIMSRECASQCNLLNLVDERFKGVAVGVGLTKTLGKIHLADMKIGSIFIPVSFIVIEGANLEFILGLDILRRYTCDINLKYNYLGINDVNVPFLSEAELVSFKSYTKNKASDKPSFSTSLPQSSTYTQDQSKPDTGSQSSEQTEKVKRLSEVLNITAEHARELLEIAGWDEELAASFVTE
ncbi:DNA-damage inducible protein ddi1-like, putative [Theileria annulata]|uniref:DNA-damage inducible protein ddi1-like, putative n=1 Tax=Theileria annulata TaxID=5874 RepID=Q4UDI9_THEAN|nr:DNA-damage inducible protein ddi1-like, putative [Theileria annulata]CAI74850.1 DNA-damage inducible protein ddi1-like, putative [Theileria annulata]|eukprot:XP_952582.1 DNA-damage inducible protein ddi1-like, putative [Theileria annulata]